MYFVFLENGQTSGLITKNPYAFVNRDLMEASVSISGYPYPAEPVKFDFNRGNVMPGYRFFLDNIGVVDNDCDVGVSAEEYCSSYFIMPFDLTPLGDNGLQPHKPSEGTLTFNATLRTPTEIPLTVLVFGCFENCIEVFQTT